MSPAPGLGSPGNLTAETGTISGAEFVFLTLVTGACVGLIALITSIYTC